MASLTDMGLWTRRVIAVALVGNFIYAGVTIPEAIPEPIKDLALIVTSYYFAKAE